MIRLFSFGASPAHQAMWLAQKMSPDTLNHAMILWDVDGELDRAAMASAFRYVLDEAEVLRITFTDGGGGDTDSPLRLTPRELGDWQPFSLDLGAEPDPEQAARDALAELLGQPFDLSRDLLFRLGTVTLSPTRSLVVIAYHHLISDGYGAGGLLSRRLAEVYTALARGTEIPEPPHPWDAGSYAATAAAYRDSPEYADDTEFWRDYLKDAPAPARVPGIALSEPERAVLAEPVSAADRWSELADAIGMVSRTLTVPRAEADTWAEAAASMGVWLSSLLTSATAVYLRHRCDRPAFLFSLAVGNRAGAASRTPGLAVNVVPVRADVPLGAALAELTDTLGDETYDIHDHTGCHYSDIQRASGTVLGDRGPFGTVVNVVEFAERLTFGDSPARYIGVTNGAFDELSVSVSTDRSAGGDLHLRLDAPAGLYSRAELRFIGTDLIAHIRAAVAAGPDAPVGALDVVTGADRDPVPTAPRTAAAALPGLTVPELFARRAARDPDAVALVHDGTTTTYRELDERSDRLARELRHRNIGPETVVAVALPRSAELVVALLAVAKSGGAQLPVDPAHPGRPTGSAAGVRALLTDPATTGVPPGFEDVPVIAVDAGGPDTAGEGPAAVPGPPRPDGTLAVMYGSGAAGPATGVAVTHRNMERLVLDHHWRDGARGPVLWHTPPTSDALPLEMWAPLLNGGRIVVAPPGEPDIDTLNTTLADHPGCVVVLPPALFETVAADRPERLTGFREVWSCGGPVSAAAVRRIRTACPGLTVVTGHGSAETTLTATRHHPAAGEPAAATTAVAGRAADHTALYVLGPGLAPVPAGVTGELYAAGPGVARGYPGHPAETARRFVPCPFGPAGSLMYRTGDRARRTAGGRIEYRGRAGDPTDIRGVPVDPAEAEAVLAAHPAVARAVVTVREDGTGQRRLVAHLVPADPGTGLDDGELRPYAKGLLPEALVPSEFLILPRLPETAGGRTDRAALPEPAPADHTYRAPRDDTERALAKAFAEVLEIDRVGIDDDFFDLGGNSLRAIRLTGLIRAELNQEVSIRTLFVARTVTGLSDMWQDLARSSRPALRRRTKGGEVL
ncbi:AMP-binding protein [Streptomyces sp. NPDC006798]|uniref:non-ribosomal peptide synthetase n=1 Tax=Streptomyces sp. NPDC006798 TaxID=3155462 RepID=UPI0033CB3970